MRAPKERARGGSKAVALVARSSPRVRSGGRGWRSSAGLEGPWRPAGRTQIRWRGPAVTMRNRYATVPFYVSVTERYRIRYPTGALEQRAAEDGLYARHEAARVHRLVEVVVCPRLEQLGLHPL